ncbi:MAG TPA: branched-chain amino acid ABC transporter permease, partial [Methylomirabilota bacterium]|nr:branched-chain amino acid ABC transporter permease [Methylomirabilota bacterium]
GAMPAPVAARPAAGPWLRWLAARIRARHVIVLAAALVYPLVATPFFTFQVGAQSLALGLIALSLTFLGGYGGMVSLAQMTVAGIAGYAYAIFATSGTDISLKWPWWLAVILALIIATVCGTLIGWFSVRTEGIYTIMITLAIGVAFFYLVQQNYSLFNGFQGFQSVKSPVIFGRDVRDPIPFYYVSLFWALAGYFGVQYLLRAPFGVALQGIRDNPRRMAALGFHVTAHRVAAYAVAGFIASVGGILFVWYNGLVSPGSVGTSWLINILVIAVLGGMRHPIGPFIGAVVFVLLQNFAVDLVDRERFNLLIGGVFLIIVLFSPDGILGWWTGGVARLRARSAQGRLRRRVGVERTVSPTQP